MGPQPSEPSGLLIAGVLFALIMGWIALIGTVAMLRQYGLRGIVRGLVAHWPAWLSAPASSATRPASAHQRKKHRSLVRRRNGRFAGSTIVPDSGTIVPDQERGSGDRSAAGSPELRATEVPDVSEIVLTVPDMLLITNRLAQGMAPSDVAKSLPGYSGRKFQQYMGKVQKTQALLASLTPAEPTVPTVAEPAPASTS